MVKTRRQAWRAGSVLLALVGLGCVAVPAVTAIAGQPGGWGFAVVGLPLLVLGVAGSRGARTAIRLSGVLAALACGGFLILVATTPLRGVTPPPGSPAPSVEPVSLVAGLAFIGLAILLAVGVPSERR